MAGILIKWPCGDTIIIVNRTKMAKITRQLRSLLVSRRLTFVYQSLINVVILTTEEERRMIIDQLYDI